MFKIKPFYLFYAIISKIFINNEKSKKEQCICWRLL